jgi:aminobenzoyl-glutamate transport protein
MFSNLNYTNFLDKVEKICGKIPQPIIFFLWLMGASVIIALVLNFFGTSFKLIGIKDGVTMEQIHVIKNVITADGIRFILSKSILAVSHSNIIPILIVAVMGLGIAEGSGYIKAFFVSILGKFKSSGKIATILLLFFGVISNIAIDAGYVVLIPLGGIIFLTAKRNPMLGVIVAFVGVSGGFTANFFLGGTDVILAGITTNAAKIVMPNYNVTVEANYYFAIASSFVVIITGFCITEFIMVKKYKDILEIKDSDSDSLTLSTLERKALKITNLTIIVLIGIVLLGIIPEKGILRNQETGDIWKNSALSHGIIFLFSLMFGIAGLIYGKIVKTINSADDVVKIMSTFVSTTSVSIITLLFAYQFLNILEFSGLALGFASALVGGIKALNVGGIGFITLIILAVGFINLFIGSASVKWTALSYILVPVFVSFGYTPELAQAAFRIGDSATNIISPAMAYMPIVLGQLQKYKNNANIGTLISMTLPYCVALLIIWTLTLILFFVFNLPLGPNTYSML